jgi:hypothetical protein
MRSAPSQTDRDPRLPACAAVAGPLLWPQSVFQDAPTVAGTMLSDRPHGLSRPHLMIIAGLSRSPLEDVATRSDRWMPKSGDHSGLIQTCPDEC